MRFFKRRELHLGRFPGSNPLGSPGLFWAPQFVFRAAKCTSGTFPRIKSPGHSWAVLGSPMCFSGNEMHIRDISPDPVSWVLLKGSGVPHVLFRHRKLYLGHFPGSGSLGALGLLRAPQCVFRATKCKSGTLPRSESLGHSWDVLGSSMCFSGGEMHIRDVFPDPVSWALLSGSGVPSLLFRRPRANVHARTKPCARNEPKAHANESSVNPEQRRV
jgi:hypothetical protein